MNAAIAANMDTAAMAAFIKADSLAFVTIDGLYRAVGEAGRNKTCPQFCDACFTGEYPTALTDMAERETPDLLTLPINKVA
jgi:amidophosphoribosyltransferase